MLEYIAFYTEELGGYTVLKYKCISKTLGHKYNHIFDVKLKDKNYTYSVPYYSIKLGYYNIDTDKKRENKLSIDTSSSNNKAMLKFKKFIQNNLSNPKIKLSLEITQYLYRGIGYNDPELGYKIKAERKDSVTNEPIGKTLYFNFWNSRSSMLFQELSLCNFEEYSKPREFQVKYPKQITNKIWNDWYEDGIISLNTYPVEKILKLKKIDGNYPLSLKQAICEYLIEELYYYILFSYGRAPGKVLSAKNLLKSVLTICYRALTSYDYKDNFSYALFKTRCLRGKHNYLFNKLTLFDMNESKDAGVDSTGMKEVIYDLKYDLTLYYILLNEKDTKFTQQVFNSLTKFINNYKKLLNRVALDNEDHEKISKLLNDKLNIENQNEVKDKVDKTIEYLYTEYPHIGYKERGI